MKYFVFDRDTLRLEDVLERPREVSEGETLFILPGTDTQTPFRKTLDLLNVTDLEVALMYRNAGNIRGSVSFYRDTNISSLYYLLMSGKALTKHTVTLFNEETGSQGAHTGHDRPVVNTVAPAKVASAPRQGNRVTIFEVADRMWNGAGSPRDISTVLQLRKTVMAELETNHGIKRTTSSTALGDWQKLRLNN